MWIHPTLPTPPRDAHQRVANQVWTERDDLLLKTLVERYPNNWALVGDAYNAEGVHIFADRRTPWDCLERWSSRWGPGTSLRPQPGSQDLPTAVPDASRMTPQAQTAGQMTTRGVKRLASASISGSGPGAPSSSGTIHEPKKLRHALMQEAIRKSARKRELEKRANSEPSASCFSSL
jgi:chromatin modification-related protein VID21